jgi:small-conductance mechanosensitive channel
MDVVMHFLSKSIITIGAYDITLFEILLMVPLIAAAILIMRLYTRFITKRGVRQRKGVRNFTRILRIIVILLVIIGSMRILGVKLFNFFDFAGAVLRFKLFTIGETEVSLLTIIVMAVVVYVSAKLSKLVRNYFNNSVFPRFKIEPGLQFSLSKLIGYAIIAIGVFIALQGLGIRLAALTVFAGVLGVGIGFGMQNITANFVSGVAILFERPIKEGDMVRFGTTVGIVQKISLRASIIRTIYNEHLIVPNTQFINSTVENMSHSDLKLRVHVDVGVAYGTDPRLVQDALLEAARLTENVLDNPEPDVLFKQFGDSSLNFELRAWISDPQYRLRVESDLHFAIVDQFKERGITIPFPQRDVYIKQLPGFTGIEKREG